MLRSGGKTPDREQTWNYQVIEGWQLEFGCRTYGLEVRSKDGTPADQVPDVSTNRKFVQALAQLFTQQDLEPVHFHEVLEDCLADSDIYWKLRESGPEAERL